MMDETTKREVVEELIGALGKEKVYHDPSDLIPYSRDTFALRFSEEDKHLADIVVTPTSTHETVDVVRIARDRSIPLIPKGGGTSRTGMLVPICGGIIIDTIRMNRLLKVDRLDMLVKVQAGINLQELELMLRKQNLTLGHEQGSQKIATVGGAISTAAYSRKNQKYGNLWERIANLEVVLGDGTVLKTAPDVPYTSSGIDIAGLFIGAEGTLGVITEATLRLEPAPERTSPMLVLFSDFSTAENAANEIMSRGISFIGGSIWEDERGFSSYGYPNSQAAMILTFEGTVVETEAAESYSKSIIEELGGAIADEKSSRAVWNDFTMHWCGMRADIGNEDVIVAYVPRKRESEFFDRLLNVILPKYDLTPIPGARKSLDFGRHMILATRFSIPQSDKGWESYMSAIDESSRLIASLGGTIAACHGVGLLHRNHIFAELGEEHLKLLSKMKRIMDPKGIMNPGKKIPC